MAPVHRDDCELGASGEGRHRAQGAGLGVRGPWHDYAGGAGDFGESVS